MDPWDAGLQDVSHDPGGTGMSIPQSDPVRWSEPEDGRTPSSEGRFVTVDVNSDHGKHILNVVQLSYIDNTYKNQRWKVSNIVAINNQHIVNRYRARVQEMGLVQRLETRLTETVMFTCLASDKVLEEVADQGYHIKLSVSSFLGPEKQGVVLSRHADIQLKVAELIVDSCWIVVFKVALGNCRYITDVDAQEERVGLSPDYDCHQFTVGPHCSQSINVQASRDQVYLFEVDGHGVISPRPRQVQPIFAIKINLTEPDACETMQAACAPSLSSGGSLQLPTAGPHLAVNDTRGLSPSLPSCQYNRLSPLVNNSRLQGQQHPGLMRSGLHNRQHPGLLSQQHPVLQNQQHPVVIPSGLRNQQHPGLLNQQHPVEIPTGLQTRQYPVAIRPALQNQHYAVRIRPTQQNQQPAVAVHSAWNHAPIQGHQSVPSAAFNQAGVQNTHMMPTARTVLQSFNYNNTERAGWNADSLSCRLSDQLLHQLLPQGLVRAASVPEAQSPADVIKTRIQYGRQRAVAPDYRYMHSMMPGAPQQPHTGRTLGTQLHPNTDTVSCGSQLSVPVNELSRGMGVTPVNTVPGQGRSRIDELEPRAVPTDAASPLGLGMRLPITVIPPTETETETVPALPDTIRPIVIQPTSDARPFFLMDPPSDVQPVSAGVSGGVDSQTQGEIPWSVCSGEDRERQTVSAPAHGHAETTCVDNYTAGNSASSAGNSASSAGNSASWGVFSVEEFARRVARTPAAFVAQNPVLSRMLHGGEISSVETAPQLCALPAMSGRQRVVLPTQNRETSTTTAVLTQNSGTPDAVPQQNRETAIPTPVSIQERKTATAMSTQNRETSVAMPTQNRETTTSVPTQNRETSVAMPTQNRETTTSVPTQNRETSVAMPTQNRETITSVPTQNRETSVAMPTQSTETTTSVPTQNSETTTSVPTQNSETTTSVPTQNRETSIAMPTQSTETTTSVPTQNRETSVAMPTQNRETTTSVATQSTETAVSLVDTKVSDTTPAGCVGKIIGTVSLIPPDSDTRADVTLSPCRLLSDELDDILPTGFNGGPDDILGSMHCDIDSGKEIFPAPGEDNDACESGSEKSKEVSRIYVHEDGTVELIIERQVSTSSDDDAGGDSVPCGDAASWQRFLYDERFQPIVVLHKLDSVPAASSHAAVWHHSEIQRGTSTFATDSASCGHSGAENASASVVSQDRTRTCTDDIERTDRTCSAVNQDRTRTCTDDIERTDRTCSAVNQDRTRTCPDDIERTDRTCSVVSQDRTRPCADDIERTDRTCSAVSQDRTRTCPDDIERTDRTCSAVSQDRTRTCPDDIERTDRTCSAVSQDRTRTCPDDIERTDRTCSAVSQDRTRTCPDDIERTDRTCSAVSQDNVKPCPSDTERKNQTHSVAARDKDKVRSGNRSHESDVNVPMRVPCRPVMKASLKPNKPPVVPDSPTKCRPCDRSRKHKVKAFVESDKPSKRPCKEHVSRPTEPSSLTEGAQQAQLSSRHSDSSGVTATKHAHKKSKSGKHDTKTHHKRHYKKRKHDAENGTQKRSKKSDSDHKKKKHHTAVKSVRQTLTQTQTDGSDVLSEAESLPTILAAVRRNQQRAFNPKSEAQKLSPVAKPWRPRQWPAGNMPPMLKSVAAKLKHDLSHNMLATWQKSGKTAKTVADPGSAEPGCVSFNKSLKIALVQKRKRGRPVGKAGDQSIRRKPGEIRHRKAQGNTVGEQVKKRKASSAACVEGVRHHSLSGHINKPVLDREHQRTAGSKQCKETAARIWQQRGVSVPDGTSATSDDIGRNVWSRMGKTLGSDGPETAPARVDAVNGAGLVQSPVLSADSTDSDHSASTPVTLPHAPASVWSQKHRDHRTVHKTSSHESLASALTEAWHRSASQHASASSNMPLEGKGLPKRSKPKESVIQPLLSRDPRLRRDSGHKGDSGHKDPAMGGQDPRSSSVTGLGSQCSVSDSAGDNVTLWVLTALTLIQRPAEATYAHLRLKSCVDSQTDPRLRSPEDKGRVCPDPIADVCTVTPVIPLDPPQYELENSGPDRGKLTSATLPQDAWNTSDFCVACERMSSITREYLSKPPEERHRVMLVYSAKLKKTIQQINDDETFADGSSANISSTSTRARETHKQQPERQQLYKVLADIKASVTADKVKIASMPLPDKEIHRRIDRCRLDSEIINERLGQLNRFHLDQQIQVLPQVLRLCSELDKYISVERQFLFMRVRPIQLGHCSELYALKEIIEAVYEELSERGVSASRREWLLLALGWLHTHRRKMLTEICHLEAQHVCDLAELFQQRRAWYRKMQAELQKSPRQGCSVPLLDNPLKYLDRRIGTMTKYLEFIQNLSSCTHHAVSRNNMKDGLSLCPKSLAQQCTAPQVGGAKQLSIKPEAADLANSSRVSIIRSVCLPNVPPGGSTGSHGTDTGEGCHDDTDIDDICHGGHGEETDNDGELFGDAHFVQDDVQIEDSVEDVTRDESSKAEGVGECEGSCHKVACCEADITDAGSSVKDITDAGSSVKDITDAGSSVKDITDAGSSVKDITDAGSSVKDITDAGSSVKDITDAGSSVKDITDAGSSVKDITDAGSSVKDITDAGSSVKDITDAGSSVKDITDAGSSVKDITDAGSSVKDITDAGSSVKDITDAGSSVKDITDAGSSVKDITDAGSSVKDITDAGTSVKDITDAGTSVKDITDAGTSVKDITDAGTSVKDITDAGTSVKDITDAGTSVKDITDAGTSVKDITDAGTSVKDITDAGTSVKDITDAGTSVKDITDAGTSVKDITDADKAACGEINAETDLSGDTGCSGSDIKAICDEIHINKSDDDAGISNEIQETNIVSATGESESTDDDNDITDAGNSQCKEVNVCNNSVDAKNDDDTNFTELDMSLESVCAETVVVADCFEGSETSSETTNACNDSIVRESIGDNDVNLSSDRRGDQVEEVSDGECHALQAVDDVKSTDDTSGQCKNQEVENVLAVAAMSAGDSDGIETEHNATEAGGRSDGEEEDHVTNTDGDVSHTDRHMEESCTEVDTTGDAVSEVRERESESGLDDSGNSIYEPISDDEDMGDEGDVCEEDDPVNTHHHHHHRRSKPSVVEYVYHIKSKSVNSLRPAENGVRVKVEREDRKRHNGDVTTPLKRSVGQVNSCADVKPIGVLMDVMAREGESIGVLMNRKVSRSVSCSNCSHHPCKDDSIHTPTLSAIPHEGAMLSPATKRKYEQKTKTGLENKRMRTVENHSPIAVDSYVSRRPDDGAIGCYDDRRLPGFPRKSLSDTHLHRSCHEHNRLDVPPCVRGRHHRLGGPSGAEWQGDGRPWSANDISSPYNMDEYFQSDEFHQSEVSWFDTRCGVHREMEGQGHKHHHRHRGERKHHRHTRGHQQWKPH